MNDNEKSHYNLWEFFCKEHDLLLTQLQVDDIIRAVEEYLREVNGK